MAHFIKFSKIIRFFEYNYNSSHEVADCKQNLKLMLQDPVDVYTKGKDLKVNSQRQKDAKNIK